MEFRMDLPSERIPGDPALQVLMWSLYSRPDLADSARGMHPADPAWLTTMV